MTAVIIWAVRATTQAHKLCLFLLSKIRNEPGGINRCKHITSHQFTKKSSKERKALETSLEDYYILYCFGGGVPEKRHFHCRDFSDHAKWIDTGAAFVGSLTKDDPLGFCVWGYPYFGAPNQYDCSTVTTYPHLHMNHSSLETQGYRLFESRLPLALLPPMLNSNHCSPWIKLGNSLHHLSFAIWLSRITPSTPPPPLSLSLMHC